MNTALLPRAVQVVANRRETAEASTLTIDGAGTFPGTPGQFNMLYPFGVGEAAISLSGVDDDGLIEHTVRSVGPVSDALRRLEPGQEVGVRGPYGIGWPVEEARGQDVLLIAGGIGLAPLRPALQAILESRADFRRVALLYGARSPQDRLFLDDLRAWRERGDVEVAVTVDYAEADWTGRVGFVTTLLPQIRVDPAHTIAFSCGPEGMMRAAAKGLLARGVAAERIHLSMERNMKCANGTCGHCQLGPLVICRDGPVLTYDRIAELMTIREL